MPSSKRYTLGIWDGHDAGAALVCDDNIEFAINEERLTRRKLEVGFPKASIEEILRRTKVSPKDIKTVAYSTTDFAKTLTRCFPKLKEEYYAIRRRKVRPGLLSPIKKALKYKLTEFRPNKIYQFVSSKLINNELHQLGFTDFSLFAADHHFAHATGACFTSGFKECLVLTLDGIGDGLSGSVWSYRNEKLSPIRNISGRDSLGIFFEHVTNLLNMRELEDEGKVMALANFAYPIPDKDNPLLNFFTVEAGSIKACYSSLGAYRELKKVLWHFPAEQFAYMAQRTLEIKVMELVQCLLLETNHKNLAYSGGVASNIKVNMLIRESANVDSLFVFPHMGDGGLAIGAAFCANYEQDGRTQYQLPHINLGPSFEISEIEESLKSYPNLRVERPQDIVDATTKYLVNSEVVMWFQGRMELGPRALGMRSILALPNSVSLKDDLNLRIKRRVWYQPFCPAILEEDAYLLLESYSPPPDLFMTCGYKVKKESRGALAGVINVDGTCRPVILPRSEKSAFTKLLISIKEKTGVGALLNTSFNLHGEPLVCTPEEALRTFMQTDVQTLVIENLLIRK